MAAASAAPRNFTSGSGAAGASGLAPRFSLRNWRKAGRRWLKSQPALGKLPSGWGPPLRLFGCGADVFVKEKRQAGVCSPRSPVHPISSLPWLCGWKGRLGPAGLDTSFLSSLVVWRSREADCCSFITLLVDSPWSPLALWLRKWMDTRERNSVTVEGIERREVTFYTVLGAFPHMFPSESVLKLLWIILSSLAWNWWFCKVHAQIKTFCIQSYCEHQRNVRSSTALAVKQYLLMESLKSWYTDYYVNSVNYSYQHLWRTQYWGGSTLQKLSNISNVFREVLCFKWEAVKSKCKGLINDTHKV